MHKSFEKLLSDSEMNLIKKHRSYYYVEYKNKIIGFWVKESNNLPAHKDGSNPKWAFSFRKVDPERAGETTFLVGLMKDNDGKFSEYMVLIRKDIAINEVKDRLSFQNDNRIEIRFSNTIFRDSNKWSKYLYNKADFVKAIEQQIGF